MDDNRVLKAWETLTPDQQKAMLGRWGSEMAWYLCKYTNTIATGLRDGMDASELARHYKIPLDSVKLAGDVAKGSVLPGEGVTKPASSSTSAVSDLPPGAVQGPIIPPTPPQPSVDTVGKEEVKEELEVPAKKKRGRKKGKKKAKKSGSPRAHVESAEDADEDVFEELAKQAKEAAQPKKKVEIPEEKVPEKQEEKKLEGPPPFHPKAQVAPWAKKGFSEVKKEETPSPIHPNAQVNPMSGRGPKRVPPEYEKSKSYAVIKMKEEHEL